MRAKILIVDDEPDAQDTLSSILQDEGFWVETEPGGEEAIGHLESERFDLLITDMKMPKMNGIEVLKKARQLDPSMEKIVMTGFSSVESAVESLKLGAADYLSKPFEDIEKFIESVNLALERQRFRKEKELLVERLDAEKKKLSTTLHSIGDGVVSTDGDHRVTFMNQAAENLTGWSQKKAVGRNLSDIFRAVEASTDEPVYNPAEKAVEACRVVRHLDYAILIAKDGKEKYITFTAAPIKTDGGDLPGAVLIFKDVTRQRGMEQELMKSKKLETAGRLAGGIAHDFNNLLTVIMGNLNMAKMELRSDVHLADFLRDAETASLQARDLVRKFTMFTTGGYPVRKSLTINDLLQDIVQVCLSGSSVECEMSIPEDLWGVYIDPEQIQQVLNSIVINSIEAMPAGGKVEIQGRNFEILDPDDSWLPLKKGKYVKLSIRDQGKGITPEDLERVFDPYFSTKTRGDQRGMGFGLTVARSIVVKNDGFIGIESRSPGGTRVDIYLPAVSEAKGAAVSKTRKTPSEGPGGLRLLAMDDDKMMRDVIDMMLKVLGHEATLVPRGEDALDLYKKEYEKGEPFDAVILDLTVRGRSSKVKGER